MKKYILGLIIGASSLGLAIPLLVQAASDSSTSAPASLNPSQACVQAMAARDGAQLSTFDIITQAQKTALKARQEALAAAATITDDVLRKDAVKKANDDFRATMKTAMDQAKTAQQSTADTLRAACGKGMGRMFGGEAEGFGPMMGKNFGGFGRGEKGDTGTADGQKGGRGKHMGWFGNGQTGNSGSQTSSTSAQ
ncbi:MAG: hypothetical protein PHE68_05335 [Candidatus Peribacteraceae bacterium]|nr:hypothetical protein [Candidatus Peribacteraceae bacterium]MDD5074756.1 hypothetical protein [Candidatus Peribacteraceae bacterium]